MRGEGRHDVHSEKPTEANRDSGSGSNWRTRMRIVFGIVCGAVLAMVHVAFIGIASIQGSGNESGAVYDLNNTVVAVAEPRLAIFSMVSIAALSGLCVAVVVIFSRRLRAGLRNALRLGYVGAGLAGVVTAHLWAVVPQQGFAEGPRGWVIEGGTMPVFGLCIAISAFVAFRERSGRAMEPAASES